MTFWAVYPNWVSICKNRPNTDPIKEKLILSVQFTFPIYKRKQGLTTIYGFRTNTL